MGEGGNFPGLSLGQTSEENEQASGKEMKGNEGNAISGHILRKLSASTVVKARFLYP